MIKVNNDWDEILEKEYNKDYYQKLRVALAKEYAKYTVYPDMYDIFNAFKYTPYSKVKVVILGQDPYHNEGQAHGLAFSVKPDVEIPPSLKNIFKEMHDDIGFVIPNNGYLKKWADNGIFLLNTTLTVRAHAANSHKDIGWETFTDDIISELNDKNDPIVFLLWGANARSKAKLITNDKHLVLQAPHPSPLSAYNGFFGCKHFSKATAFLKSVGKDIDWSLE